MTTNKETKTQNNDLIEVGFVNRLTDLRITDREKDVLKLIASGRTNKEISEILHLSTSTVRNHISNIFVKLNITNRSQATATAIYAGLINSQTGETEKEQEEKW